MENFNEILKQVITSEYAQLVSVDVNGEANWGEACAMDEDEMEAAMAEAGYDTEGMISGQMFLDLFVDKRLAEIVEVVNTYGDFAAGSDLVENSKEWYGEGFTAAEVDAWIEAEVFTAEAAAELRDAELSAEAVEASKKGYAFANGDIIIDDVKAAVLANA